MPDLEPITREEKLWSGENIVPITREEMYIKHIYDKTQKIPSKPITRKEMLLERAGEGGGSDVTIKQLSVTANGTYSQEGTAYSPVIVNVPKTPLNKLTVTENGTYTAPTETGYDEVNVNVPLPSNAYLLKEIEDVDIASFSDGSNLPMPKLQVGIEPIQEGSGDPSPTNVRPISGHTEANVTRCGKNLVNWKWNTFNEGKMEIFLKGGTYTLSAEAPLVNGNAYIRGIKLNGEYCTKQELGLNAWSNSSTSGVYYGGEGQQTYTFNVPDGGAKIEFGKLRNNGTINAQLEIGNTVTAYEPYNGHTYTIDLDGTRYGGTLDVVSGVLTVDRVEVDISTFTWTSITGGIYAADLLGIAKTYPNGVPNKVIFEKYQSKPSKAGGFYPNEPNVISLNSNGYLYTVADTSPTGQCVYELATPLTIQLPPTVVKSLMGMNNVYADSGDVLDLSYLAKEE